MMRYLAQQMSLNGQISPKELAQFIEEHTNSVTLKENIKLIQEVAPDFFTMDSKLFINTLKQLDVPGGELSLEAQALLRQDINELGQEKRPNGFLLTKKRDALAQQEKRKDKQDSFILFMMPLLCATEMSCSDVQQVMRCLGERLENQLLNQAKQIILQSLFNQPPFVQSALKSLSDLQYVSSLYDEPEIKINLLKQFMALIPESATEAFGYQFHELIRGIFINSAIFSNYYIDVISSFNDENKKNMAYASIFRCILQECRSERSFSSKK